MSELSGVLVLRHFEMFSGASRTERVPFGRRFEGVDIGFGVGDVSGAFSVETFEILSGAS